jgi:hypothetical protein
MAKHPPRIVTGARTIAVAALLLILVVAGSLSMYFPTRTTQTETTAWGAVDNPNRVDITAWITKVDPAAGTVTVTTRVEGPSGSLSDDQGYFLFDADLYNLTALQSRSIHMAKDDFPPVVEQRFQLNGMATDYPFDHYNAALSYVVMGGPNHDPLPIAVTLYSTDPFFVITPSAGTTPEGVDIDLHFRRSSPTLVYASFVMVLMLGLAVAAGTAAYYALKRRKGLLFPACSMMAAMLFALVPLRNAVPGSPPIGSAIDFGSFFIAAITIAISLITCVVIGYRVQLEKDREDDEEDDIKLAAYRKYLNSPHR